MPDRESGESAELQFDRAVPRAGSADARGVRCARCRTPIATEYFDINGHAICGSCRASFEGYARPPAGVRPLVTAGVFGLGAGVAGAAIYYAVIAIAHVEIGIVAILIGYMVGRAVRAGAGGRGGRRFQVLAAALTYASVALAYTPMVVGASFAAERRVVDDSAGTRSDATREPQIGRAVPPTQAVEVVRALIVTAGFVAALPVIIVLKSLPFGAISGFIIYIGMQQAWRMTGAARLRILGPYRVGAPPAALS